MANHPGGVKRRREAGLVGDQFSLVIGVLEKDREAEKEVFCSEKVFSA